MTTGTKNTENQERKSRERKEEVISRLSEDIARAGRILNVERSNDGAMYRARALS